MTKEIITCPTCIKEFDIFNEEEKFIIYCPYCKASLVLDCDAAKAFDEVYDGPWGD